MYGLELLKERGEYLKKSKWCILCQVEGKGGKWYSVHRRHKYAPSLFFFLHVDCYAALGSEKLPSSREIYAIGMLFDAGDRFRHREVLFGRKVGIMQSGVAETYISKSAANSNRNQLPHALLYLPLEIRNLIYSFTIPSPYASVAITLALCNPLLEILRSGAGFQGYSLLDRSKRIYLERKSIAGQTYITHCSNQALSEQSKSEDIGEGLKNLIFLRDEIGVRELYVREDSIPRVAPDGCFYKSFDTNAPTTVHVEKRAIVVDVHIEKKGRSEFNAPAWWDVHPPPAIKPENCYPDPLVPGPGQCMRYIPTNANLRGVMVSYQNNRFRSIHLQLDDGRFCPDLRTAGDLNWSEGLGKEGDIIWLYSPLKESIRDIWVRFADLWQAPYVDLLIIETTSGKILTFGPFIEHARQETFETQSLRHTATGDLKAIAMEIPGATLVPNHEIILALEFDSQELTHPDLLRYRVEPDFQRSEYGHPLLPHALDVEWYLSSVFLDSVLSAQICFVSENGRRRCLGIIFELGTSTVYLGQWRPGPDFLSEPVAHPKFLVYRQEYEKTHPIIYDASFSNSRRYSNAWTSVLLQGLIEFWFSCRGAKVQTQPVLQMD